MIVNNINTYNYLDYKMPISNCYDMRSAYYRGHSEYQQPQRTSQLDQKLNYDIYLKRDRPINYGTENSDQYTLKFPLNNFERAERTFTSDRPQMNQWIHTQLKHKPPKPINMFQTIQRQDYNVKKPIIADQLKIETTTSSGPRVPQDIPTNSTSSYCRHLDIYVPTTMRDFIPYTAEKQHGIAEKDFITVWDWLETPKSSWGYGLKQFPGKIKEWQGEPLYDRRIFSKPIMERTVRNVPKFVKNAGLSTEMRTNYKAPVEQDFKLKALDICACPIPPTNLRTASTEYSMYGSGRPIQAVIINASYKH